MRPFAYLRLLAPIVRQYRKKDYAFWRARIGGDEITQAIPGRGGRPCQVEIQTFWDAKEGGAIRVVFSIDDGGWRAWCPVTTSILVDPDGF